jgi:hypothetical protein
MTNDDSFASVEEVQSLRSRGLITAEEAYRRHTEALASQGIAAPGGPAGAPTGIPVAEADRPPRIFLDVLAIVLALMGGLFGIVGALVNEFQAGGGILLAIAGAPIIEEAMKPAGIYILLVRWPRALRGQLHTATLTTLSALSFGLVESFVYVTLYHPGGGDDYALFRFTVPVATHMLASFVVGLGLTRGLIDWAEGRAPLPKATRNFYLAGVALHAAYNISALALTFAGVLDFD